MFPAAIFLFLVGEPFSLLLPAATILVIGFSLLAIPLHAIVHLPLALHLLLPVGQCRRLVLLYRRMQLGLATLQVNLLLSLDLLLLLGDCCRRGSVLLLGCSHGRRMLLLLLLGGRSRCNGLLLLMVDLDHRGRVVPDVVMCWRRGRWLLLLLLLLRLLLCLLLRLLLRLLLLFRDRGSLLVLVRDRHRLLLDGEINQRGKCVVTWDVVMGRRWHQVQTIRRRTRWFGTGSTAADSAAGSAAGVVTLNDSLPLGWRRRSVRARSAENG